MDPKTRKALHWPRLDTVLMVENTIERVGMFSSKKRLSEALSKEVMPQTLNIILDYLKESGKIEIRKRRIIWVKKSEKVKEFERMMKKIREE